jgi:hypothetical protein
MPADKGVFEQFPNPVFVETGMWEGRGIQAALQAGFPRIISMDIATNPVEFCARLFLTEPKVSLHQGNSVDVLPKVLRYIGEPVTFWLDAHSSGDWGGGGTTSPIIQELNYILYEWGPPRGTVILIDDWRLFRSGEFGPGLDEAVIDVFEKFSLDPGPQVVVTFVDGYQEHTGHTFVRDILVAKI